MGNLERRERRWWLTLWDTNAARQVYNVKPPERPSRPCEVVEVVPADQLRGAVEITDEMCAAALAAERSQRWHSDELRVWAILAAARDARGGQ